MRSWSTQQIPSLTGRTAVVTGANGGLGLESTKALAGAGAHVVMAARDQTKAERARQEVLAAHPDASLEVVELDLGSLASVANAAEAIRSRHDRIELLLNNAGVMAMPERRTEDGFEMQFGVDHLGHWALTSHLLPVLVRTPGMRVVTVTSTAQHTGRAVDPDNPHLEGSYGAWRAYGQAKLANRHFAVGLHQQLRDAGLDARSLCAHPGLSNTDLQKRTVREGGGGFAGGISERLAGLLGMNAAQGALSQLRAATDPAARSGTMYGPLFVSNGPPVVKPLVRPGSAAAVATLWEVSRRETGLDVDVAAALQAG